MAETVVLHVGAMKSGTSYLQARLFANQEALGARGALVPGRSWGDQVRAVRDVLGQGTPELERRHWGNLVEQVSAAPGTAVVSMEFLGPARPDVARSVVASFGGAQVRVVVTARDLNRSIAAMWQETIQNGRSWTWPDYVHGVCARRPGAGSGSADRTTPGGTFWRQQNLSRIVETWSRAVDGTVALVTIPPPGGAPDALWRRFCAAAGLPADGLADIPRTNESLGLASTLVLRRLNEELEARGLPFPHGQQVRKRVLAKTILAARRREEDPLGLPVADWVRQQAAQTTARLQGLRPDLFGDWADLIPVPVAGTDPGDVAEGAVADAAFHALAELVQVMISR